MERFRITQLEVNEIGPFGHLVLEFPDKPKGFEDRAEIHILTGENGTGKTTVLETLAGGLNKERPLFLTGKCRFPDDRSSFVLNTQDTIGEYREFGSSFKMQQGHLTKMSSNQRIDQFWNQYTAHPRPLLSVAFFAYSGYRRIGQVELKGIQELSEEPLEDALNFQHPGNPNNLLQWIANTKAGEAIAKSQGNQSDAQAYHLAISNLEKTIALIIGKQIQFVLETKPYTIKIVVDGTLLDFNLLPDGLKSIISWLADLLVRMDRLKWKNDTPIFERNFILLLDEIEVHTHPAWQRKILPAVQGLFPNAQIFVSTHSPFIVNSVDGAWIHRFVKNNGDSQLAGPPILSEDGKSIGYVLEEIFNISEQFGPGATQQLEQFYQQRNEVLKGANGQTVETMMRLARDIAKQSEELHLIVEMELRQINRRKQLSLTLD